MRDQVKALRALGDVEVELYEFPPGGSALLQAARELHRRYGRGRGGVGAAPTRTGVTAPVYGRDERFDVVHAHFGLSAWPALAVRARARALTVHGTDVHHPRTRAATRAVLPFMDLVGRRVGAPRAGHPGRAGAKARAGAALRGGHGALPPDPPRAGTRASWASTRTPPSCCSRPTRRGPSKRYDRAQALAGTTPALQTLGGVDPELVPLWVNAANAVLVPSEREGFGLAVLEALACDVPVLATPVGVHAEVLAGLEGTLCAPLTSPPGGPPWSPTCARPTPASAAASAPSASRPSGWQSAWRRHGAHYSRLMM